MVGTTAFSIWNMTFVPAVLNDSDPTPVELGVKFRSQVNGYVTGVRFYKGTDNVGPHVGHLWSSTGTKLAEATFTNESASGWQRVTFPSPVPISADITYTASYHTSSGHGSLDRPYFASSGHVNPPLEALANGADGPNGVFAVTNAPGAFPSTGFQATNYWVDVHFTHGG